MVSFRYHIVSLTAVFLALALGIGMGVTVIDKATVDSLNNQLNRVRAEDQRTDEENSELRGDIGDWSRFGEDLGLGILSGRLQDVPVLVVAVGGVDGGQVDGIESSLQTSGADVPGTLWLEERFNLADADDLDALGAVIGGEPGKADEARNTAFTAVAAHWADFTAPDPIPGLIDGGFVRWEPVNDRAPAPSDLPQPGSLIVVVSHGDAKVTNDRLGVPFVREVSGAMPGRVLAVESLPPGTSSADSRTRFVLALRKAEDVAPRISTVDGIEGFRGRVAMVLALQQMVNGRTGHYGFGEGAGRTVPELNP